MGQNYRELLELSPCCQMSPGSRINVSCIGLMTRTLHWKAAMDWALNKTARMINGQNDLVFPGNWCYIMPFISLE